MYDPEFITSTSDVIIFEGDNSIVIRRSSTSLFDNKNPTIFRCNESFRGV